MQYKNRKIYSKTMNQYVNNAYLKDLINLGTVFRIIDKETNKDITYRFLKRIKNDGKRT